MKLVPTLHFWGAKKKDQEDDILDELAQQQIELPPEEEQPPESDRVEEKEEKEEKENTKDEGEEKMDESQDDMLKVFLAAEEEFVDNSALVNEIDDVPAGELLEDLRAVAAAFHIRPPVGPANYE